MNGGRGREREKGGAGVRHGEQRVGQMNAEVSVIRTGKGLETAGFIRGPEGRQTREEDGGLITKSGQLSLSVDTNFLERHQTFGLVRMEKVPGTGPRVSPARSSDKILLFSLVRSFIHSFTHLLLRNVP